MFARDVMTKDVISAAPEATVQEIAHLLLTRRISAVPVVDAEQRLVGIVSEGDLMHRKEAGTERPPGSWWLRVFDPTDKQANQFTKTYGRCATDVMTSNPVTVTEDTSLGDIATLLEEKHIKRVPVLRDGKLVGIVSRANLLHGLATWHAPPAESIAGDDNAVREHILQAMEKQDWVETYYINVTVNDGAVHLWGVVDSIKVRDALTVLAKEAAGVNAVENHLGISEPWMFWAE